MLFGLRFVLLALLVLLAAAFFAARPSEAQTTSTKKALCLSWWNVRQLLAIIMSTLLMMAVSAVHAADANALTGDQIIQQGRKYLGVPYRLGGAPECSRSGMDCDCFTKIVFNDLGKSLGWWDDQLNYGYSVSTSNIRPGDLLFFSEDGSGSLTHIAIASYNGYVLHASSYYGKVVESDRKDIQGLFAVRRYK